MMYIGDQNTHQSFEDFLDCYIAVLYVVGQLHLVLSLRTEFGDLRIPLHKLDHNDLDLCQGQMLTNTRSGPSTEYHRSQVLLLFALLVLPALRIELKRAIKIIWIEQKGWPLHCDTSSFFKTNSSDFHLLFDFPIKDPYRRKHSRNLVDHAL